MIELLQAEYIKHKKKLYIIFILLFAMNFFCIIRTIQNISEEQFKFDIFSVFYNSYGMIFIISYMAVSLFGFNLFYNEFKNNMMKQLLTTSITNTEFIATKMFFTFLFSEIVMILYALQLIIIVLAKNISFEINDLAFVALMSIFDGFLLFLAILPLFAVFIYLKDNVIVSLLVIISYAVTIILASIELFNVGIQGYLHPLMNIVFIHNYFLFNHIKIADYGILENAIKNINIFIAFTSVVLYSIVFSGLIAYSFRKIRK